MPQTVPWRDIYATFNEIPFSQMPDDMRTEYLRQMAVGFIKASHGFIEVYPDSEAIVHRIIELYKDLLEVEITYPNLTDENKELQFWLSRAMCDFVPFFTDKLTSESVVRLIDDPVGKQIVEKVLVSVEQIALRLGSNSNPRLAFQARINQARIDISQGNGDAKGRAGES